MNKKLYLIPSPLSDGEIGDVIPQRILDLIQRINTYVVEDCRTVRRYLSKAGLKGKISDLEMYELNEHTSVEEIENLINLFEKVDEIGLVSEAGLPAVADPGAKLVELCHKKDIQVIPLVGPSSLMLALMSSGLNGQCFAFNGYLPIKNDERKAKIRDLEKESKIKDQSQLFIETPYRNDSLMSDLLNTCKDSTKIAIAVNITAEDEQTFCKEVWQWKKSNFIIGKRPCVFILQS